MLSIGKSINDDYKLLLLSPWPSPVFYIDSTGTEACSQLKSKADINNTHRSIGLKRIIPTSLP